MVGTARFELATPCTPSKCATRLRYVPTRVRCRGRQRGVNFTILRQEDAASRVSTRPFSAESADFFRRFLCGFRLVTVHQAKLFQLVAQGVAADVEQPGAVGLLVVWPAS